MAVTAKIKFFQNPSNPPAGEALIGVTGVPVQVSNEDNSNVESWEWEVVDKPPTSAVPSGVVASGNVPIFDFTPDQPGGYHLHLTVIDIAGNKSQDFRVFQVPEPSGYIIPPFDAEAPALNFGGQKRGWAKYAEELLRFLLTGSGGGAVTWTVRNVTTSDTVQAGDMFLNCDTGAGAFAVDLPASPAQGRVVAFGDAFGDFGTFALTIDGNGNTINGASTLVLDEDWGGVLLIWDGTSDWHVLGKFPAGGGGGAIVVAELPIVAGDTDTDQTTFGRKGARRLDMTNFPATIGPLTREVRFKAVLENTVNLPSYNAEVRLYDVTHAVAVTASTLDNTGAGDRALPEEVDALLVVGNAAGDIRDDVPTAIYEVQLRGVGILTPPVDRVILSNARVEVVYV